MSPVRSLLSAAAGVGRRAKHALFVSRKRTRRWLRHDLRDHRRALAARLAPYRYDPDRYRDARGFSAFDHFLDWDTPEPDVRCDAEIPNRLWCFWTTDVQMPPARRTGLEIIRSANTDLEVILVTPANLDEWLVPEHPLHESYHRLSAVHRSDYLRAYFLHHHGGAYADIKPSRVALSPAIQHLAADSRRWLIGYQEFDSDLVGNLHGQLGDDVRRHHRQIAGIAVIAARPGTPFTAEWLAEVERRLDYYSSLLERFPARDPRGATGGYPVTWIGLGADVFQPLQLKYLDHIEVDADLRPQLHDYQ